MNDYYPLLLALGTLAVSSSLVILITDVISIYLYQSTSTSKAEVIALVSSTLHGTSLVLMTLLVYQYFKNHQSANPQVLKPRGYLIAFAGLSCVISSIITALELVLSEHRPSGPSSATLSSRPRNLVTGAFISGAASMLSQSVFVICLATLRRRRSRSATTLDTSHAYPDTQESLHSRPSSTTNRQQKLERDNEINESDTSLRHHSIALTEKLSNTRSSLSSLSSLIHKFKSPSTKTPCSTQKTRTQKKDLQIYIENKRGVEDDDDYDGNNSVYSLQPPQSVELIFPPNHVSKSLNHSFQFLETIPASPTDPTPNIDLESRLPRAPQAIVRRRDSTRSYSPANSYRESKRYSRSTTPVEMNRDAQIHPFHRQDVSEISSTTTPGSAVPVAGQRYSRSNTPVESNRESHIHPLFRTDSTEPPPAVTPGTVVTAAPGAGQVISYRASIRSLKSKKSGGSLQSRGRRFSSSESLYVAAESDNRSMPQLHDHKSGYGINNEPASTQLPITRES